LVTVPDSDGPDRIYVVTSKLPEALARRLLFYGTRTEDLKYWFTGVFEGNPQGDLPPAFVRLSFFVEPRPFTDKSGHDYEKLWSLLSYEDGLLLHDDWKSEPRYTDAPPPGQANYYQNCVLAFEHMLEERWSQRTK
jgi:hypothetical protein